MNRLEDSVDQIASETGFSGVVRVDRDGAVQLAKAYGRAHRGYDVANAIDTRFGIASGTKGLTALTVVSLIEEGRLAPTTTARSLLGDDLPLIGDDVTVEHLLAHRSGIGDYLDEEAGFEVTEYVLPVPVHELVRQRVCEPAGMRDTEFLRSDELPGRAALGYLTVDGPRTNVLHLPVRGSGDGGIYSTAADVHALWSAFLAGKIVPADWVAAMVRPRSDVPSQSMRYGLGFWLHKSSDTLMLEGSDAGVSFRTVHDPVGRWTHTVLSNTTSGAWPIARHLDELLTP